MTLLDSWQQRTTHPYPQLCPVCDGPVNTIAVTKLVYTHEVCSCGFVDYDHLTEVLYHRACLERTACERYVSWKTHKRTSTARDCWDCGRPESAHRIETT